MTPYLMKGLCVDQYEKSICTKIAKSKIVLSTVPYFDFDICTLPNRFDKLEKKLKKKRMKKHRTRKNLPKRATKITDSVVDLLETPSVTRQRFTLY